jgi:UDP-2,4-diacetamido-2,4,6-trideoxy-beta-L-altropyranose hydrolase
MGTGHVMRCLALAQGWQDLGGDVALLAAELPEALAERCREEGIEVRRLAAGAADAQVTAAQAAQADWLVVDGYHFDAAYVAAVTGPARRVLQIDDLGMPEPSAVGLILNQNVTASPALYPWVTDWENLLLGGRHALLRREFRAPRPERRFEGPARRLLVSFGGSDPCDFTRRAIEALLRCPDLQAKVVVGAANPRLAELRALAAPAAERLEVLSAVTAMVPLMDWADFALSAGGSSVLELAARGLPALVVAIADNQTAISEALQARGLMRSLGWHESVSIADLAQVLQDLAADAGARAALSAAALDLTDGRGALRVAEAMLARSALDQLRLRPATEDDARLLLEWANDPAARAASFQGGAIGWEEHVAWLGRRLADPDCLLWLVETPEGEPAGVVRFDLDAEGVATISLNLAPAQRGRGLASPLILAACQELRRTHPTATVRALIKPENTASQKAFARAGFEPVADVVVAGQAARCMIQRGA